MAKPNMKQIEKELNWRSELGKLLNRFASKIRDNKAGAKDAIFERLAIKNYVACLIDYVIKQVIESVPVKRNSSLDLDKNIDWLPDREVWKIKGHNSCVREIERWKKKVLKEMK